MNKKIMILGASILQLPAIKKAKEMGIDVVAVDMNPDAIGFEEGVIKEVISTIDIPAVVEAAKKHKIDGIMTLASDMPMRTVAAVAKELGLVGISESTALKATNKVLMRQALFENNVPIPKFYRVSNEEEYKGAITNFVVPFIVKPADNSGSRGIYLVDDISDLQKKSEAYLHSKKYSRNGEVVVEEYMRGLEVSVETLTIGGVSHVIQITDKLTTGAPHFVEMGHSQPSQLPENTKNMITQITKDAIRAIGIENGPSHTEIIVTDEGPKIVEIGARLGGDCITTHLVPLSTGVDMVENCIKISLDMPTHFENKFCKSSAIRYFDNSFGVIKSVSGIDDAKEINGVQQISLVYSVGDTLNKVQSSSDRAGFVISQAESVEEAVRICETVLSRIKIETGEK